jgi:hypothetical protein
MTNPARFLKNVTIDKALMRELSSLHTYIYILTVNIASNYVLVEETCTVGYVLLPHKYQNMMKS